MRYRRNRLAGSGVGRRGLCATAAAPRTHRRLGECLRLPCAGLGGRFGGLIVAAAIDHADQPAPRALVCIRRRVLPQQMISYRVRPFGEVLWWGGCLGDVCPDAPAHRVQLDGQRGERSETRTRRVLRARPLARAQGRDRGLPARSTPQSSSAIDPGFQGAAVGADRTITPGPRGTAAGSGAHLSFRPTEMRARSRPRWRGWPRRCRTGRPPSAPGSRRAATRRPGRGCGLRRSRR